jgi:phosphohistidine phosphatase SixA
VSGSNLSNNLAIKTYPPPKYKHITMLIFVVLMLAIWIIKGQYYFKGFIVSLNTLLVRHGQYEDSTGTLNEEGQAQAKEAARKLVEFGLGSIAVLSSDVPRALQTGEIIAAELSSPIFSSRRMNIGGNRPEGIEDLDDWLKKALDEAGADIEPNTGLVVVTHGPLIKVALHGTTRSSESEEVEYGQVVPYVPGSWNNKDFAGFMARNLERRIKDAPH